MLTNPIFCNFSSAGLLLFVIICSYVCKGAHAICNYSYNYKLQFH